MTDLKNINTFDALETYLRQFQNFCGDMTYDCGGVITLLRAILDNLHENREEACLIINGYLDSEQKSFLSELAVAANAPEED